MSARGGPQIAVILLDENGVIVDAHASCVDTFGWQREELIGKDVRELLQYGRDLLMSQLHLLEENDTAGNTSFTIRVLAKRKDQQQFPARATVRRFRELECWTVAFYQADGDADSNLQPAVSPQEIALAKRALEEHNAATRNGKPKKQKDEPRKGDSMSVGRLWRNSRLLFSSRDDKPRPADTIAATDETNEPVSLETPTEQEIASEAENLAAQCVVASVDPTTTNSTEPEKLAPAHAIHVEPTPAPRFTPAPEPARSRDCGIENATPAPVQNRMTHTAQARFDTQSHITETAALARLKAELEKERGERSRIEQRAATLAAQVQALHLQISESLNLEQHNQSRLATVEHELRTALESAAQYKFDLENLRRDHRSTEDQLSIARELNERLQENLSAFEQATKTFQAAQAEFHQELERSNSALHQAESALDSERDARQKLEQSLANATRDQRSLDQKFAVEIAELKSALEIARVEANRAQEQILRSRGECLATINDSATRTNRLRANFTCVLQHINGTTRELLQSPLTEEQKCVIEALLQDVISLESTLERESNDESK